MLCKHRVEHKRYKTKMSLCDIMSSEQWEFLLYMVRCGGVFTVLEQWHHSDKNAKSSDKNAKSSDKNAKSSDNSIFCLFLDFLAL